MDKELSWAGQKIRFDSAATAALYQNRVAGAEKCGCVYCKNFSAQRTSVYPKEFLALLEKLGADPLKEWEVFEYSTKDGRCLYGGWFVFSGELIEGADLRPGKSDFYYWFTSSFLHATLPKDVKCAIEFVTEIPWTLREGVE